MWTLTRLSESIGVRCAVPWAVAKEAHPDHLLFSSPNVMAAFTQHATMLPELTAQVPLLKGDKTVKNREARLHRPASIIRPTEVRHVQHGAYGADLGPDPRDAAMAAKAFGPNRPRLARLKHSMDPRNVLAYACPLPKAPIEQKLIILVTGESCAGKDYCADVWVSVFIRCTHKSLTARAVSISDAIKQEYAAATGADLSRLLGDRAYKEQHRPALTTHFFRDRRGNDLGCQRSIF
ncbi:MAG: hypothetical protein LQ341_002698 [Variospora aurantia]|nr:MAG: hypothetical protein LQ341_002698 [Variospora aurantia]